MVAGKVRALATSTQDSTNDIEKMIDQLQSSAKQAQEVMHMGQSQTEDGVNKTQEVKDLLNQITESIHDLQSINQ